MVITTYPQKLPTKAKSANSSHAFKKPSGALGSNDYKFSGLLHLQSGSNLCYQSWKLTLLKVSVNPKQGWMSSTESSIPKQWKEKKEKKNRGKDLDDAQLYPTPPPCSFTCGGKVYSPCTDWALGETILPWKREKNGGLSFGWACITSTQTPSVSSSSKYKHENLKHMLTGISIQSTRFYSKKSLRNIAKYLDIKRKCRKN